MAAMTVIAAWQREANKERRCAFFALSRREPGAEQRFENAEARVKALLDVTTRYPDPMRALEVISQSDAEVMLAQLAFCLIGELAAQTDRWPAGMREPAAGDALRLRAIIAAVAPGLAPSDEKIQTALKDIAANGHTGQRAAFCIVGTLTDKGTSTIDGYYREVYPSPKRGKKHTKGETS